jgi:hypothetical protein
MQGKGAWEGGESLTAGAIWQDASIRATRKNLEKEIESTKKGYDTPS